MTADHTCACPQCRVRRALFGDRRPTDEERSGGIWDLAFVLGGALALYGADDVERVLRKIVDVRSERIKAEYAASQGSTDLSVMEAAGHG